MYGMDLTGWGCFGDGTAARGNLFFCIEDEDKKHSWMLLPFPSEVLIIYPNPLHTTVLHPNFLGQKGTSTDIKLGVLDHETRGVAMNLWIWSTCGA